MKTNPIKKLVIAGMGAAMIAAAVGSIGGTVAWFQYNTRATAAYTGAAAHCTENLEVRLYRGKRENENSVAVSTEWKHDLLISDIEGFIKADRAQFAMYDATASTRGSKTTAELDDLVTAGNVKNGDIYFDSTVKQNKKFNGSAFVAVTASANDFGTEMYPVTSGGLKEDGIAANLYKNPIEGYCTMGKWGKANLFDYVELPLQFRVLDVNGVNIVDEVDATYLAKKLYIADIRIEEATVAGKKDISDAIRVAVGDYTTFSKSGEAVITNGKLDLNDDGKFDQGINAVEDGVYHYEYDTVTDLIYGVDYVADDLASVVPTADLVNKSLYHTVEKKVYRCVQTAPATYGWQADAYAQAASTKIVKADNDSEKKIADVTDPYNIKGAAIGTTTVGEAKAAPNDDEYKDEAWYGFTVRLYVEGWQTLAPAGMTAVDAAGNLPAAAAGLLNEKRYVADEGMIYQCVKTSVDPAPETYDWVLVGNAALWGNEYNGAQVRVGLGFAAEAHVNH